jgi:hypothetical protein
MPLDGLITRPRPSPAQKHLPFTTVRFQQPSKTVNTVNTAGIKYPPPFNIVQPPHAAMDFIIRPTDSATPPLRGKCQCGSCGWSAMFPRGYNHNANVSRHLPSHLVLRTTPAGCLGTNVFLLFLGREVQLPLLPNRHGQFRPILQNSSVCLCPPPRQRPGKQARLVYFTGEPRT